MKVISIVFLILFSSLVLAKSIDKGNGGDVVFCNGRYELYDFYESRKLFNIQIDKKVFSKNLNQMQVTNLLVDRIKKISPIYARYIDTKFYYFYRNIDFDFNGLLKDIDNDSYVFKSPTCLNGKRIQAAYNFHEKGINKQLFYMNKSLFLELDTVNKIALILHEFIYQDNKKINKFKMRKLVSLLFSKDFFKFKNEQNFFNYLIRNNMGQLNIEEYDSVHFNLNLSNVERLKNNDYLFKIEKGDVKLQYFEKSYFPEKLIIFDSNAILKKVYVKNLRIKDLISNLNNSYKTIGDPIYTGFLKTYQNELDILGITEIIESML